MLSPPAERMAQLQDPERLRKLMWMTVSVMRCFHHLRRSKKTTIQRFEAVKITSGNSWTLFHQISQSTFAWILIVGRHDLCSTNRQLGSPLVTLERLGHQKGQGP